MNDTITILLATYNGGKYLDHQLNSIVEQSYLNWHLLIRDDHSGDGTMLIVEKYINQYPGKIDIVQNKGSNRGSLFNFNALLEAAADAKYIMFCDQDDEWKPDKIAITFSKMQELEKQLTSACPILVFTNFQYVDEEMNIIKSKKNFKINRIKNIQFAQLLAQNPVYGCTTMMNRALANKVTSIPTQAENHDYWIALVASIFGCLYYLNEETVLYRQHNKNVSGNFDNNSFKKRVLRIFIRKDTFKIMQGKKRMLMKLKDIYYQQANDNIKSTLNNFMSLYKNKSFFLVFKNIEAGVFCQKISQTFLLYMALLLYKDSENNE